MLRKCKTYTCSWLRKFCRTCSISAKSTSYLLAVLASLDLKSSSSPRSFVAVVLDNALPYRKWKIDDSRLPFNSQFGIQSYGMADLLLNLGLSSSESLLTTFDTVFSPTFCQAYSSKITYVCKASFKDATWVSSSLILYSRSGFLESIKVVKRHQIISLRLNAHGSFARSSTSFSPRSFFVSVSLWENYISNMKPSFDKGFRNRLSSYFCLGFALRSHFPFQGNNFFFSGVDNALRG